MDDTKKTLSLRLMELEKKYRLRLTDAGGTPLYKWRCLDDPGYCPCPEHLNVDDALIAIDTLIRRIETHASA